MTSSNLTPDNITSGMKVIFRGSSAANMAARRGATGIVDVLQSNERYIYIFWDENELRYKSKEYFIRKSCPQQDGRYYYKDLCLFESDEGQAIFREISILYPLTKLTIKINPFQNSIHQCPLCGNIGDDLVFRFYCSNNNCKNYKE
jgi:hypothetical protein